MIPYNIEIYTISEKFPKHHETVFVKINGIGPTKAIEFLASIELGRRVYTLKNKNIVKIPTSFPSLFLIILPNPH